MNHRDLKREEALVAAARSVLWALRDPLRERRLPVFSMAALLILEEALEPYRDLPADPANPGEASQL